MTRKTVQAASQRNTPSHLFASRKGKDPVRSRTSESIAADIAAFKKRGGRIEILGVTPFRPYAPGNAFRSTNNTPRKAPAAAGKAARADKQGEAPPRGGESAARARAGGTRALGAPSHPAC